MDLICQLVDFKKAWGLLLCICKCENRIWRKKFNGYIYILKKKYLDISFWSYIEDFTETKKNKMYIIEKPYYDFLNEIFGPLYNNKELFENAPPYVDILALFKRGPLIYHAETA